MSHNITVEGGKTVRLTTAGKYCDRDIIVTAEGGKEDLDAVLTEQDGLIDELREVLRGKGSSGETNQVKFIATPTSTSTFTVENPLGGTVRKVFVRNTADYTGSTRKIQKYVADAELGIGAMEVHYSGSKVRYTTVMVSSGLGNAEFQVENNIVRMTQYSSANTWDTAASYEVEIWQ